MAKKQGKPRKTDSRDDLDDVQNPGTENDGDSEAAETENDDLVGDNDDAEWTEEAAGDPELAEDSLREMMAANFIEYASYTIRDRAIPDVTDGLKPVQRRILHSLHVIDDGRFHKVANVIGHTMQYHPHGDASIGGALVVLANKRYFIDRQGNFGNIYTGDPASAARYIECRLTPLAREVLFNREITEFIPSYDGRNKEPVALPAKVPSLLMLGSDGIAVGMTTRILPHNFRELLEGQIAILKNEPFSVYPDFAQGGIMDVSEYKDGKGRITLRAVIDELNDKTLVIREIPATTTTESLINSIEDATKKGKIKIAGISDYTADKVEIEISLPRGIHAEEAIKQLYAYTECETSITSNILVIRDNMPVRMTVSEVLRYNTEQLTEYLRRELEIELGKLHDRFHERTLAEIFIENRIYKRIEECETFELVMVEVRRGLEKFRHLLIRDITDEDIEKLLQLQIRRISRFDINKNHEELDRIAKAIEKTNHDLAHLKTFTIAYIRDLLNRFGKDYERRTRISDIEQVDVREVALHNIKVGHDRQGQFVGTEVKNSNKTEPPLACTEFDRLVLMRNDGTFKVVPIPEKLYVGPIKYLFRADKEQVYSMIYRDRKRNTYYAKRFQIQSYIMDKEYGTIPKGCIIEGIYTNYGVVVRAELTPNRRRNVEHIDIAFDEIELRSTAARGFKVVGYPVETFVQVKRGTPAPDTETEEPMESEADADPESTGQQTEEAEQQTGKETIALPPPEPATEAEDDGSERALPEETEKVSEPDLDVEVPATEQTSRKTPAPAVTETSPEAHGAADVAQEWRKRTQAAARTKTDSSKNSVPREPAIPDSKKAPRTPSVTPAEAGPASTEQESVIGARGGPKKSASERAAKKQRRAEGEDAEKNKPDTRDTENAPGKSAPGTATGGKKPRRSIIDEETPFFLE